MIKSINKVYLLNSSIVLGKDGTYFIDNHVVVKKKKTNSRTGFKRFSIVIGRVSLAIKRYVLLSLSNIYRSKMLSHVCDLAEVNHGCFVLFCVL